ncbi:hypothetical protein BDV18DRAFT_156424 [Aspergillus unguis]
MLLTLNSVPQNGIQRPHEHLRFQPTPRSLSPPSPEHPVAAASRPAESSMDSSRSTLPRPSSLTLPPPDVGFANMPSTTVNQQLPPPPAQWQSSDDGMQHWLRARAEEDRRKQEEEKTRQESLRLEQRRVEQSMLRDSLMAGIPPHIVPLIFAGICQNGLPQPVVELAQQYLSQTSGPRAPQITHAPPAVSASSGSHSYSHSNPQSRRPSMHARQDSGPYIPASAQHVVPPPRPPNILLSQNAPPDASAPPTPQQPGRRSLPSAPHDPRAGSAQWAQPQSSQVNWGPVQYVPGSSVPVAQVPPRPNSQSRRSPPSLYFHHWTPPAQSQAGAAYGKNHRDSPASSTNSRRSEHHTSPSRKRKASGPHQDAPVPSSRSSQSLTRGLQASPLESPRNDIQLRNPSEHRRQVSEASAHRGHLIEHMRGGYPERKGLSHAPKPTEHQPVPSKGRGSTDQKRSEESSPIDGSDRNFQRTVQRAYASSVDTGPRDSDIEPGSHQSPRSEAQ